MSDKIKPCPFCGSAGILYKSAIGYSIMCQNTESTPCDMGNTHHDWTEEAAIEMWNKRATDARIKELEAQCGAKDNALKIIYSDAHFLKLEWFIEQGCDVSANALQNIRKWSEHALKPTAGQELLSQLETAREALKLYANIEHWDNYESEHILSPGSYEESYPWLPAQTALSKLNPQIANSAKGEVEKEWNRKV